VMTVATIVTINPIRRILDADIVCWISEVAGRMSSEPPRYGRIVSSMEVRPRA
jgi:hypothetical protein